MLELFLCSMVTVFPDYLYRRYVQGKRFGREITLYSVWYELRWGITLCLVLTILLITTIFYYHPSTKSTVAFFRTVPLLPEGSGRVEEIYVDVRDEVKAGQPIFKLDSSEQEAALETARRRVSEIDAALEQAVSELAAAEGRIQEAESSYQQAVDELQTKSTLLERDVVARREVEKLQIVVAGRQGTLDAARASKQAIETQISLVLPAQKASAEAAQHEAQVELNKTVVYAGVDGRVEQFTLRKGDIVNPLMRPAGILVPSNAGRRGLWAGFGQIEAQVMKVGMVAEVACISKPLTIIPMVVTEVQDLIAAGQVRPTDQLIDPIQARQPGTIAVFLEPLYEGGFDGIPPGSHCIANAYTNNHDRLAHEDLGTFQGVFLHAVDTVALVHAMILRVQALLLPVQTLVLSGH
jgi:multidrug resistance efflux pump